MKLPCAQQRGASLQTPDVPVPFAAAHAGPRKLHNSVLQLQRKGTRSRKQRTSMTASAAAPPAIEKEEYLEATPDSLLRAGIDSPDSMRGRFEAEIRKAQDAICAAVEELDGGKFHEDAWTRPGGGGGISRVLQGGNVWEKAGVNVSVVYGSMPAEAYRAATAKLNGSDGISFSAGDRVPFFAAGISSVMHPHNPFAPTMHFNYRYFETDDFKGVPGKWWFGGGSDITPSYVFEEDMKHFHGVYKRVCNSHDKEFFPRFKKWADDYFLIKHREERRGLGGIFFDDMEDRPADELFAFSKECMHSVVESYLPIVERRKDQPFTEDNKAWQQLRRGRYVEFNLVYDRGTTFGLKTGGRIESILMSLPLTARWEYDQKPVEGSPEWDLLQKCRNPVDWV